jgi:hypothetical protein
VKEYVVKQLGLKASFSLSAHASFPFSDFFSSRTGNFEPWGFSSGIGVRGPRTNKKRGNAVRFLLAVDLGLKTGLALFGEDGKLRWYRSKNFGTTARLKRAVYGILKELPDLAVLVIEGGGSIAEIWAHEAQRRGTPVRRITAEDWRAQILYPRERQTGARAKERAAGLADTVIAWSGLRRPTAPRHDAAEAILIGLWGVIEQGWLGGLPPEIRHGGIPGQPRNMG